MITDEATLTEELELLKATVEGAIVLLESRVGFGAIVTLHSVTAAEDETYPKEKTWVVNVSARIQTNTLNEVISI